VPQHPKPAPSFDGTRKVALAHGGLLSSHGKALGGLAKAGEGW
jgi:hypothetical protein